MSALCRILNTDILPFSEERANEKAAQNRFSTALMATSKRTWQNIFSLMLSFRKSLFRHNAKNLLMMILHLLHVLMLAPPCSNRKDK